MTRITPIVCLLALIMLCAACNARITNSKKSHFKPGTETPEAAEARLKSDVAALRINGTPKKLGIRLTMLGSYYDDVGRYDEALAIYQEVLGIYESSLGKEYVLYPVVQGRMAGVYSDMYQFKEAERLYLAVLESYRPKLNSRMALFAEATQNIGRLYYRWGRYDKAFEYYRQALELYSELYGQDSVRIVSLLNKMGLINGALGRFDLAKEFYLSALQIHRDNGIRNNTTANLLNNLGNIQEAFGDYGEALRVKLEAYELRKQLFGADSLNAASSCASVGSTLKKMGRYSEAEKLLLKSHAIRKTFFDEDDGNMAGIEHTLGWMYQGWGKYEEAMKHYWKSLGIKVRTYGEDSIKLAMTMNNMANVDRSLGNYATAEIVHRDVLALRASVYGEMNPDVAQSLSNLAKILAIQGEYEQALRYENGALEIRREIFGEESLQATYSLSYIAWIEYRQGNSDRALELLTQCLEIQKGILGDGHVTVIYTWNDIAAVHNENGQHELALDIYKQNVAALESVYGKDSPKIASSLNQLGKTLTALGRYDEAEAAFTRAMGIRIAVFQEDHPSIADDLYALATLEAIQGKPEAAAFFAKATAIVQRNVDILAGTTAETRLLKYLSKMESGLSEHLSFAVNNKGAAEAAMNAWLQRKGMALEAQRIKSLRQTSQLDSKTAAIFQELETVREQLSDYLFASGTGTPSKQEREDYERLMRRKQELERQIAVSGTRGADISTVRRSASDVIASLQPGSALIDIARIPLHKFDQSKRTNQEWPEHYLAFVIRHGSSNVQIVDLGAADGIDSLVKEMLSQVKGNSPAALKASSESACRRVFDPLRPYLGDAQTIYVSPDSYLNLIPFEVLREPGKDYLIDSYTFIYLGSGRDLLAFSTSESSEGDAMLMGDPDFDLQTGDAVQAGPMDSPDGMHFSRLIGTRNEVEGIRKILGEDRTEVYLGAESTEAVLRSVKSPRVLHLATHGFFLDEKVVNKDQWASRGIDRSGRESLQVGSMFRSGLALAGANEALKQGHSRGITTAEELMALDLRGTELVVLSACETGVGDVVNGQGVFGLRRAFVHAGARSLVMSMWSIPDRETEELMVDFYSRMEAGESNRAEALRAAMLGVRENVRTRYGSDNPFYWGSFVFMGNPD